VAACGTHSTPPPPDLGALDVVPGVYDNTALTLTDLNDGDLISLIRPPQGGFVLFLGARVRGLHDASVELRGRLLDPATGALLTEEGRTVDLLPSAGDPSLFVPDLRSYTNVSNVPVCPSSLPGDHYGHEVTVEVVVTEKISGRAGGAQRRATPSCRQTDPTQLQLCQCECAAGFMLGKCTGM
jgi:hypothetical protein